MSWEKSRHQVAADRREYPGWPGLISSQPGEHITWRRLAEMTKTDPGSV